MTRRPAVVLPAVALAAAVLVAVPAADLRAQDTTTRAAATRVATPGAQRAAEELLRSMRIEEVLRSSTEATFDAQVKSQPLMAPFRATMQEWANKYLTWSEYGPKLTRIYAEEFTEPELRQLIAFYNSPIGRKVAELNPVLTRRGAQAGAEVAEAHIQELQQMIQARATELQAQGKLPSPSASPPPSPERKQPPTAAPAPTKP